MKKIIAICISLFVLASSALYANAQMMRGFSNTNADWEKVVSETAQEEKQGEEIWSKLRAKEINCSNLNDNDFEVLGEYFMGQMMGDSHAAMNAMMAQAHGEDGEEQIHIVMGKRLSGCDTSASYPASGFGWMSTMNMMGGNWSSPFGYNSTGNTMMNLFTFGFMGLAMMIFWWVLIIVVFVALIKWLIGNRRGRGNQSALDILKQRYARGEIDSQEFEEKRKNLVS